MYPTGLIPCCASQDYGAGVDYTRPPPAGSNSTGGGDPSLPNFGAGDMPLPADLAVRFGTPAFGSLNSLEFEGTFWFTVRSPQK